MEGNETIRCQCPERGVKSAATASWYEPEEEKAREHEPNQCPGDYELTLCEREGQQLWLCSCCTRFGDKRITTLEERIVELRQVLQS